MCVCGCGYVGCMCVCGPAAGAARLKIEYAIWCAHACSRARGDLVCCSCNYVAENIVRVGLRGTTYTGALRRPARSGHTILAPLRLRRGRGWLPEAEQPAAWKPQTLHTQPQPMSHRNLRQCPHALSVPRRAHVPPAEAHLRPLPPRSSVAHTMCRGWPVHVSPTPPSASPPLMPRSFALACTLCCCVSHAYLCCGAPPCRLL
jgi:hypothetical protein